MNQITRIKDMLKSRTAQNGIWLYALQFFNTIIPLVTVPYITRILGAEKYGVFSVALNITMYLQVVVEYGFALSATRKVALESDEKNIIKIFTEVICSRGILYILSMLFTIVYIGLNNITTEEKICLLILNGSLIGYCIQENWIFQGKQEMKFISVTNIAARLLTTISIFCYVKDANDIYLYCILYTLSPVIANIIGTWIAVRRYKLKIVKIGLHEIKYALKDGMYIFFTQLSSKVFGAIGVTFLGIFVSNYEVGIYSAVYKIPYMLMLLWTPISQVLYPYSSRQMTESFTQGIRRIGKARKYCLILFGALSFFIGIMVRPIIWVLFGKEYISFFYIIYPLLIWVLLGINNNFIGIQIMVGGGFDKEYSRCFQIGVVGTIIFNFVFIYKFGMFGAALAPMFSEGLLTIILGIQMKKIKSGKN